MRRRVFLGRVAAVGALAATGLRGARDAGVTLVQGAGGQWFAAIRGSLFRIGEDGAIGSDAPAQAAFRALLGR